MSRGRRMPGPALVSSVALASLAGCGAGDLADRLPRGSLAGLEPLPASRMSLTATQASRATTLPAPAASAYLDRHGYTAGAGAVWRGGTDSVTAVLLRFDDGAQAQGWVALVMGDLAGDLGYAAFRDPAAPGARGWLLTARVQGSVRFCAGEWTAAGRDALGVTRCADHPLDVASVTGPAAQVRARALPGAGSR